MKENGYEALFLLFAGQENTGLTVIDSKDPLAEIRGWESWTVEVAGH